MTTFPVDRFKEIKTPFYYYDTDLLDRTIADMRLCASVAGGDRFKIHYAVKANANREILFRIARARLGADCVSGGEIQAALDAGISPSEIVFAGVGKTDYEIRQALMAKIAAFNVESLTEAEVIAEIAKEMGLVAEISLRVNPDIDAHTHHYITTGLEENKFGIDLRQLDEVVKRVVSNPNLNLTGLHFHIGSQITDLEPYRILCRRINAIVAQLTAAGVNVSNVNVGGGLGVNYDDPQADPIAPFGEYFSIFAQELHLEHHTQIHFELGRAIVAQCGSLISKVLYIKEGVDRRFAILDAGMTDLIRPALYQAYHKIINLSSDDAPEMTYDIVGPICESSDVFGVARTLPQLRRGDLVAILSAGAYGEAMASRYNLRELPGSYFSDSDECRI